MFGVFGLDRNSVQESCLPFLQRRAELARGVIDDEVMVKDASPLER